jgi:ribose 5-phosphate isomerase B
VTTTAIAVGSDSLGHELKEILRVRLVELGYQVDDFGVADAGQGDYPDVAERVAVAIRAGRHRYGVLVCGTGAGMAIAANKVSGIRAVCVTDPYTAERARASNDAQIITLGSQITTATIALRLLEIWLHSEYHGGRSAPKVAKIAAIESRFAPTR